MSVVTFDARANPVSIDEQIVHVRVNDRLNAAAVFPITVRQDDVSPYVQELSPTLRWYGSPAAASLSRSSAARRELSST